MKRKVAAQHIEVPEREMLEFLKQKTPQERLEMGFQMWESAKKQLNHHLKITHPDWSASQIHSELVKRLSHGAISIT